VDKAIAYRSLIKKLLSELGALIEQHHARHPSGLETECVFDEQRDHYMLVNLGWQNGRRVRGTTLHVRIKNGKFWIEDDMTEEGIANQLIEAGVPKEDIVLAFQPPEVRPHTEFAVA
jgi:hypothetical protein